MQHGQKTDDDADCKAHGAGPERNYREYVSVVTKQVYGPVRPRDLDRADRRSSKGPGMTCSKERVLHGRYHVSFVPRVRQQQVACSEWQEKVVALAAAYWSGGFDMHRRLRETDRTMTPSNAV
jgi:hypothetical protein